MRYKAKLKLDLTIVDDQYSQIRRHPRKNPIGEPLDIEGSLDDIKDEICRRLDVIGNMLEKWNEGKEEEINV